jgi:hypothetical protein
MTPFNNVRRYESIPDCHSVKVIRIFCLLHAVFRPNYKKKKVIQRFKLFDALSYSRKYKKPRILIQAASNKLSLWVYS